MVRREFPDLAEREVQDETAGRKAYLDRLAEMVRAIRPGVVTVSVLSGEPGEAIASYAAREGVDFIVLTTHGRGRVARWCLGSVADTLLRRSEPPRADVEQGGLPAAGSPEQDEEFAPGEMEVHPAQGMDLDLPHPVNLGERHGLEHRIRAAAGRGRRSRERRPCRLHHTSSPRLRTHRMLLHGLEHSTTGSPKNSGDGLKGCSHSAQP
jgi:universal stress protein family protein